MSFFKYLVPKKGIAKSVVLVAIGADSVAGAYARYEGKEIPTIVYSRRLPIEARTDEALERAMLRALKLLGADLVREGAPALARQTGNGSIDQILVSIEAPWQETSVRVEEFEPGGTFEFTRSLVEDRLEQVTKELPGHMLADESVIGTMLNGYETRNPYGKDVHRASVTILTSLIERQVAQDVVSTLSNLYHTKDIVPISGISLRYQAIRTVFPHERDAIVLDVVSNTHTTIALVRKGGLVSLRHTSVPADHPEWVATITDHLADISKHDPLPRTIFLLTQESESASVQKALSSAGLNSLWLSENPPKIVAVSQSYLLGMVRCQVTNPIDLSLLLMALYYQTKEKGV